MRHTTYASIVSSLMYVMLYALGIDICYAVETISRYQSNPRLDQLDVG